MKVRPGQGAFLAAVLFWLSCAPAPAALIDRWVASGLATLDDGDAVGSWTSIGGQTVVAIYGDEPRFARDATPTGEPAIRFEHNRMSMASSPVSGLTQFSLAVVFKVSEPGVDEGSGWSTKSGIVDANQGGAANDWGFSVRETGYICFGTGSAGGSDQTVYLDNQPTYPSVVDGEFHVAVCTWSGGSQSLYLDELPAKRQSGVSTAPRSDPGISFGGLNTGEGTRQFVGELAEVQLHDTALAPDAVAGLITELRSQYITRTRPTILEFRASANRVLAGSAVTLSWLVTNATSLSLDPGVGPVTPFIGSFEIRPTVTTTYTLTASNSVGMRTAQVIIEIDPGIPFAEPQQVAVIKDTARSITLKGNDPQGEPLTYAVAQAPQHGTLNGAGPLFTYQPDPGYVGSDFFTFTVHDGKYDSPPAAVQIFVDDVASPPHGVFLSREDLDSSAPAGTFLAALRTVDRNRFDTHVYTLAPGLGATHNDSLVLDGGRVFAGPGLTAPTNLSFRVRATDSSGLFLERVFTFSVRGNGPRVLINEVHYNPPENPIREEFVELHNPGADAVDISGWRLAGGVGYVFPASAIIGPGGFLVVASSPPTLLSRHGVTALGPWTGNLSSDGERLVLRDRFENVIDEVSYRSEFPWPIAANGNGPSMELIHPALDNDLGSSWAAPAEPAEPSPGTRNRAFATNAAPNLRQVNHAPKQPAAQATVTITAKVTDPHGVASVVLKYQVVPPGNFIPAYLPLTVPQLNANPSARPAPNPVFETETNWAVVPMHDDGFDGDLVAGDDIYTALLPPQPNRTLVRYRVLCADSVGASRTAPFADDPSLNFAYFVYDGVPAYGPVAREQLETLPVYFLITRAGDFDACAAYNAIYQLPQFSGSIANEARFVFNWPGAIVYDGEVYDHIRYRLRGANGRYQPGKRSFRIRFNDGRFFAAKDEFGQPYPRKWASLNTAKGQSNRQTLTFALNEYLNYLLLNKVGVPSPYSHYFHWRVIRGPQEAPDPYGGDFYGISWTQEEYDAAFLETHNLPKGNLYKLINAQRATDPFQDMLQQQRYQGPFAVTDGSDAVRIQDLLLNPTASQTDEWLLANVNYTNWYAYHAILEAVRNYDTWPSANKNAAWYFDTDYAAANQGHGRFWTLPWDWTDTWGPTWNAGQDLAWNGIFGPASSLHRDLQRDYRNTVREIRDLLFQPDQINPLIDAVAARIAPIVAADLMRWSNSPPTGSSYRSLGMPGPALSQGLSGYVRDLKNFMFVGGNNAWWIDRQSVPAGGWIQRLDSLANDSAVPAQPAILYVGPPGFPANALTFETSAFSDPQGGSTFAGMQWRVAAVLDTNRPPADAREIPPMEWDAAWQSGTIPFWSNRVTVPGLYFQTNRLYRARVRHLDNSGRWSKWSAPLQFSVSPVDLVSEVRQGLRFTEIMYHPPALGSAYDSDDLEFLELMNLGQTSLDLSGLLFEGITYSFPPGSILAPGQSLVLGRNDGALRARYPGLNVAGIYSGKLDNAGEALRLITPAGETILEVAYADGPPWPVNADGMGWSLVLADPVANTYRSSTDIGGSPGTDDPVSTIPRVVINELLTSTDPPLLDAVELFNPSADAVDVSGWFLSDDAAEPMKYRIPEGTSIAPAGYLVIDETAFNRSPGGFAFSSLGDQAYLFSGSPDGTNLTGYVHGASFGAADEGVTFGRVTNSASTEDFVAMLKPTIGTLNTRPRVGPVVIAEILFNGEDEMEFIELQNVTATNVPLFCPAAPANTWRLRNAVDFDFPPDTWIRPHERWLVVGFDPATNAAFTAEFRSQYSVPANTPVSGPWVGRLDNAGESIELKRPAEPQLDGTAPHLMVEKVSYRPNPPWPGVAVGVSLQRAELLSYANEPRNWYAAEPTPGVAGPATSADVDRDGLPDPWELDNGTDPLEPDSEADPDADGFSNRQEFLAGTHPNNSASALRFDSATAKSGSVLLSFTAVANRSYSILSATTPDSPVWITVTNIPAGLDNHTATIEQSTAASRFYRLRTPALP